MNVNSNIKHVRFDTPSKGDRKSMERQSALPSVYFRDDSDMEYSPKPKQRTSFSDHRSNDPFEIDSVDVSSDSNYQAPDFNPPLKNYKQNISPKPSHDLELSLLDSTPPDFMVNNFKNRIPPARTTADNFRQDYYSKTFQNSNQYEGSSETDMPYMNFPTKTPVPKSISSLPSSLLAKIPPVSQQTKESPTGSRNDTKDGHGFFTLPNSGSYFPSKNNESSPMQSVEKSKNNYHYNTVLQAKNDYQCLDSRQNNNFQDFTPMNERPDPRCCNDKPPKPMLLPTVPMFNATHYNPYQNTAPNYPSSNAYHQYNGNTAGCQQAHDPNCRQVMPAQPCCSYPNGTNINHCVTQGHHAHQYTNENMQHINNYGVGEHPKALTINGHNFMQNPENINSAVDIKRKAIESRCVRKETTNICNDVVKVDDKNIDVVSNKNDNKSEPTVSDLYQIIKLQNEQLQMLQQRVDKLLTVKEASNSNRNLTEDLMKPVHDILSNQDLRKDSLNMNCIEQSMHKISIGVMTSFEVVMSSNILSKRDAVYNPGSEKINPNNCRDECVQTSQMFENFNVTKNQIKEKQNAVHNFEKNGNNFLDGIAHCNKGNDPSFQLRNSNGVATSTNALNEIQNNAYGQVDRYFEDNFVQQNALRTQSKEGFIPMHSDAKQLVPNSSLHLRTEEYSDSDDECSQPNAGWTFYNNVMNRVNDMLHSPPAMNKDITKDIIHHDHQTATNQGQRISAPIRYRGENYVEKRQPLMPNHFNKPVSETSLHMKRLAAKYLIDNNESMRHESKVTFSPHVNFVTPAHHSPYVGDISNEMSFATIQYMKRYHLMSDNGDPGQLPQSGKKMSPVGSHERYLKPIYKNPSRILDITTLKQQPKLM